MTDAVKRDLFSNGRIAHSSLRGQVTADRFTDGETARITQPAAKLTARRGARTPEREVLYGHRVCQLDPYLGLCRDETSGYVGYIEDLCLGAWAAPTHRVGVRATLLFEAPDFKTPDPLALSLGSLVKVIDEVGRFARTHDGRYLPRNHLTPLSAPTPDLAATAALLIGTPYLWGGNSAFGIDCSGLVQIACQAAQIPCPGDSDQQVAALGSDLPSSTAPKRNDLMFWKGHVAVVY